MATTPLPITQTVPTNHIQPPNFTRTVVDGVEQLYTLPDLTQTPWKLESIATVSGISLLSDFNLTTGIAFGSVSPDDIGTHVIVAEVFWNMARSDGSIGPDPGFHDLVNALNLNVRGVQVTSGTAQVAVTSIAWELYATLGDSTLTLLDSGTVAAGSTIQPTESLVIDSHTDAGVLIRVTCTFDITPTTPHGDKEFVTLFIPEANPNYVTDIPNASCVPPGVALLTGTAACTDEATGAVAAVLNWSVPSGDGPITYQIRRQQLPAGADMPLVDLAAGTETYTDTTLGSGIEYLYWVKSINDCGDSLSAPVSLSATCPTQGGGGGGTGEGPWLACAIEEGPGVWTRLVVEG